MSHFSNFWAIFQHITREPFLTRNETLIAIFKHCDHGLCSTVNEYIPCLDPHIGWTPDGGWYMLVLPLKYSGGKSDAFSNANVSNGNHSVFLDAQKQEQPKVSNTVSPSGGFAGSSLTAYSSFSSPYTNYYYDSNGQVSNVFPIEGKGHAMSIPTQW